MSTKQNLGALPCLLIFGCWVSDKMKKLTALFDGLIGHVPAVCMFVAHFLHADTLPTATLEHGRAFTRIFYGEEQESMNFNFNVMV